MVGRPPRSRTRVQFTFCSVLAAPELVAQQVSEQRVTREPLARSGKATNEYPSALEPPKRHRSVSAARHGVAERSGHPIEHRRLDQKATERRWLLGDHLIDEKR